MEELKRFQSFMTVQELDEAVEKHKAANRQLLHQTDIQVLHTLAGHAVKYPGVAKLKVATLAAMLRKSEKTIRRSLNTFVTAKILKKQPTIRPISGGYGACIFIFLPYDDQSLVTNRQHRPNREQASVLTEKKEVETNDLLKQVNNTMDLDTVKQDIFLDDDAMKGRIPEELFNVWKQYLDAKAMCQVYGILLRAKARVDASIRIEENDHFEHYNLALKRTLMGYKLGKVRSFYGYLFRAFEQASKKIKELEEEEKWYRKHVRIKPGSKIPNWLEM